MATNNYMADDSEYSAMTAAPIQKEYGTCEEALKTYVSSNYSLAAAKSPKEPLTRGEVVQMLLNTADDYNPGLQKSDVIKGYEDGELHEDWFVTRAEALVCLLYTSRRSGGYRPSLACRRLFLPEYKPKLK